MKGDTQTTKDVEINEDVSFRDMMLSEQVLNGLTKCDFLKPSPIQLRAIPIGRCGLDLIIQSKSGTGKTLVFCTIILEKYDSKLKAPQSLIVVPTREIALQVESYLNSIGSHSKDFSVTSVIGGRDIAEDRKRIGKCKAIVGTPGRILHLIKNNYVCLQHIQTLVLDEADKLMTDDFYHDINVLLNALNQNRQIIASSATYANGLDKLIVSFMHNPIAVSTARDTPVLIGVKQFLLPVDNFTAQHTESTPSIQAMWRKVNAVEYVLRTTAFKQCILFSNSQFRANSFANYLIQNNWTVELVLGSHDQSTRTATIQKFRQYKSRILVTSDLMARGVDIVNINLVINLDVPSDSSTYLHRIGRCGRFGRRGLAITLVDGETEMAKFQTLLEIIGSNKMKVDIFPISLDGSANFDAWSSVNRAESHDSCIFESDEKVGLQEQIDEKPQQPEKVTKLKAIEDKDVDVLEVAKLLIDTEPSKTHSFDIDLFSSYEHRSDSKPVTAISVDIFEDFANGTRIDGSSAQQNAMQINGNTNESENSDEEHKLEGIEQKNAKLLEVAKLMIDIQPSKVDPIVVLDDDLFSIYENRSNSDDPNRKETTQKQDMTNQNQGIADRKERWDYRMKQKVEEKPEKSCRIKKKAHPEMQKGPPGMECPATNDLWTNMFWHQLRDINKYIANSHSLYKFKSHKN